MDSIAVAGQTSVALTTAIIDTGTTLVRVEAEDALYDAERFIGHRIDQRCCSVLQRNSRKQRCHCERRCGLLH